MVTVLLRGAIASLGGVDCATTTFVSATLVRCSTPVHAAGVVTARVTNVDATYADKVNGFTYLANYPTDAFSTSELVMGKLYSAAGDLGSADGALGTASFNVPSVAYDGTNFLYVDNLCGI